MNYVTHLNHWFEFANSSKRIKRSHVCLYLGLFQLWNSSRFSDVMKVNRRQLMELGKIGSKTTYSNCMKDFEEWGVLKYTPCFKSNESSEVEMRFLHEKLDENGMPQVWDGAKRGTDSQSNNVSKSGTATGPVAGTKNGTGTVPKVGHNNKTKENYKQNNKRDDFNDLKNKYNEPL